MRSEALGEEAAKIQVEIRAFSILREVLGAGSILIEVEEEGTIADLLNELNNRYGEAFQDKTGRNLTQALRDRFNLFLNGKIVKLPEDSSIQLGDQDKIVILQPVGGGL